MKTAAVTEFKASFSEYLSKIRAGEEVLITKRGKPVAKLIPVVCGRLEIPAHLVKLEQAGLVRTGTGKLPSDFWDLPRPKDNKSSALGALLEERENNR